MNKEKYNLKFISVLAFFVILYFGCDKLSDLSGGGDRLYFCEKYMPADDKCQGQSDKYTTGSLTVMVKLNDSIGVAKVDINITDLNSGQAVKTIPFDINPAEKYIYFEDVSFDSPGKYKVSCLKEDGTVIVSNTIEIISG